MNKVNKNRSTVNKMNKSDVNDVKSPSDVNDVKSSSDVNDVKSVNDIKSIENGLSKVKIGIKKTLLPKVNKLNNFRITYGKSHTRSVITLYTLSFAIVAELLNKIYTYGFTIIEHFINPLLKDETDFDELKNYIQKKSKNNIFLDLSHRKKLFKNVIDKGNKKGSSAINETYLYCNKNIKSDILTPIYKLKNNTNLYIKIPTVSSSVVVHVIELYSFIFEKTFVLKSKKDSFLKDSFILCCENANEMNLIYVKEKMSKIGNVDDNLYLKTIFEEPVSISKEYLNFTHEIIYVIYCVYLTIFNNIDLDIENKKRNEKNWKKLDDLFKES